MRVNVGKVMRGCVLERWGRKRGDDAHVNSTFEYGCDSRRGMAVSIHRIGFIF